MIKTVSVKLEQNDIDRVKEQLEILADDFSIVGETLPETIKNLVEDGEKYANQQYASFEYRNSPTHCTIKSNIDGLKGSISLVGKDAFYEEFGTGELGARDPHPTKNRFDVPLNEYNSGPFVSTHVRKTTRAGWHYWIYYDMRGQKGYLKSGLTYGIPSGKMMYNTGKHLHNELSEKTKDLGEKLISKFK